MRSEEEWLPGEDGHGLLDVDHHGPPRLAAVVEEVVAGEHLLPALAALALAEVWGKG